MISIKSSTERRKDPRISNNIPVKICQDSGDLVTETKNISRSGAYCCVTRFIEPMTKLKVHLLMSHLTGEKTTTRKVTCEGIVVRSEPAQNGDNYNVAIFFSDITKRDAQCITDFVNQNNC